MLILYSNYFQYFGDRGAKLNFQRYYAKSIQFASICDRKEIKISSNTNEVNNTNPYADINVSVSDNNSDWTLVITGKNYLKEYYFKGNQTIKFPENSDLPVGEYNFKVFYNHEPLSSESLIINKVDDGYIPVINSTTNAPFGIKGMYAMSYQPNNQVIDCPKVNGN
ncbi:MAG: hypothetical protein U0457_03250 [Candidatus Sericytochromatia bacterium]